ncbi:hypothetical protein [Bacteroides reticulotermitis]|nr:hypothetical protein [Bacteroides reticulotermitis]MBB4043916.1 hypothetical protein [Bacteroides reticulotermitis]
MEKRIQKLMICLFSICLFSACDEENEAFKDCLIENSEIEDTSTTRSVNNVIRAIKGNTEPFVGTRQTYKVELDRALSINTRVRIVPSSDAILVAYGSTYLREHTITMPVNTSDFLFEVLIRKPADYVDISVASEYGGEFFVGRSDRITCKTPEIKIDAPTSVLPNTQFEISTDHIVVPNLTKGYEWSHTSFRKADEYLSGSKIKVILQSPTKTGDYSLGVKTYGKYNHNGNVFSIGEVNIPIKVLGLPYNIEFFKPRIPFPLQKTEVIEIQVDEKGKQYYDRYEWKIPGGCVATFTDLSKRSKARVKISQTGSYRLEARGVIIIGGKTYYSNWKAIDFDVHLPPCTIEYKVSKVKYLKFDEEVNVESGVLGGEFPGYFTPTDVPHKQFLIGTDPQNHNIHYYYLISGLESDLIVSDPTGACSLINYYPGAGIPVETISVHYE